MKKGINILIVFAMALWFCIGIVGCTPNAVGTFYTIEEAYENGWLTRNDLMEVCYHRFGEVWIGESSDSNTWIKYEYNPQNMLSPLEMTVENDIKETYYSLHKSEFFDQDGNSLGGIDDLSVQYYGTYNNSYVIVIECSIWETGQTAMPTLVAGVAWWETGDGFWVYRDN